MATRSLVPFFSAFLWSPLASSVHTPHVINAGTKNLQENCNYKLWINTIILKCQWPFASGLMWSPECDDSADAVRKALFLGFCWVKKKNTSLACHSHLFLAQCGDVSKPVDTLNPLHCCRSRSAFHSNSAGLRAFQNVAAMPSELLRALEASRPGAHGVSANVQNLVAFWGGCNKCSESFKGMLEKWKVWSKRSKRLKKSCVAVTGQTVST